jgi:hypothetical protein
MRALFEPICDTLELLHRSKCYHRDVAPDNILLCDNHVPVLLDFGAARKTIEETQVFTAILKPGYAPIEQYGDTELKQGAWTDIYALAGVMHFTMAGQAPQTAVSRMLKDSMRRPRDVFAGKMPERFLDALEAALAVKPEDRPQDIAAFRALMGWNEPMGPPLAAASTATVTPVEITHSTQQSSTQSTSEVDSAVAVTAAAPPLASGTATQTKSAVADDIEVSAFAPTVMVDPAVKSLILSELQPAQETIAQHNRAQEIKKEEIDKSPNKVIAPIKSAKEIDPDATVVDPRYRYPPPVAKPPAPPLSSPQAAPHALPSAVSTPPVVAPIPAPTSAKAISKAEPSLRESYAAVLTETQSRFPKWFIPAVAALAALVLVALVWRGMSNTTVAPTLPTNPPAKPAQTTPPAPTTTIVPGKELAPAVRNSKENPSVTREVTTSPLPDPVVKQEKQERRIEPAAEVKKKSAARASTGQEIDENGEVVTKPRRGRSTRCAALIEAFQLGSTLSADDQSFLQENCR